MLTKIALSHIQLISAKLFVINIGIAHVKC
jgi:hypothetical protein